MFPKPNIVVRLATDADIDEIVRITNRAYLAEAFCVTGDRTNADDIRAHFARGHFLVVDDAADPTRLIGSVHVTISGSRGYLGMLTVDPDAQGRGMSGVLVSAVENHCRAATCNFLDLTVINIRANLFPFYAKLGFAAFDVMVFPQPHKVRMPLHLVKMTKALCKPELLALAN